MKRILLLLVACVILSGCATVGVKDAPVQYGDKFDLTVRPEASLGVRATPALKAGKVTVVQVPMSDSQIGGEMYPGRIMFPGWWSSKGGGEGFVQFMLVGNYPSGDFMAFAVLEGTFKEVKNAKFIPLSSRTDCTWNQVGKQVQIDRARFYQERSYRDEVVKEHGLAVNSKSIFVDNVVNMISSWSIYTTTEKGVDIYTPLSEEDIKAVAAINPGYNFLEKLILRNRTVISPNPIGVAASIGITVFNALTKPEQGFDFNSELPSRQHMAMMFQFMETFRKEMIRERNEQLAQQEAQIQELKRQLETALLKPQPQTTKTIKNIGR